MSLTTCPDCRREVSDRAPSCPGCGRPIAAVDSPRNTFTGQPASGQGGCVSGTGKGCLVVIGILFLLGLLAGLQSPSSSTARQSATSPPPTGGTVQNATVAERPSTTEMSGRGDVFAITAAPCYLGPSKASGRFFFVPNAKKAMTLNKDDKYTVLETREGWSKIQLFPPHISEKTAWVESKFVATSRSAATEHSISKERLTSFDEIEREGKWRSIYAGTRQEGMTLTFYVNDRWNGLSPDMKEACARDLFMLFFQMGGPRNIVEKPGDFKIEYRHKDSNRVVASWNELTGLGIKG